MDNLWTGTCLQAELTGWYLSVLSPFSSYHYFSMWSQCAIISCASLSSPGLPWWLPRGEAEDSAFLSIRDTYLLEPNEWTQGCRASSSVWREDSGLLSRAGRKRRPSARDDGGVSWVSTGCSARGGFLTRHDSIHGILQARILEWVATSFSRGSS